MRMGKNNTTFGKKQHSTRLPKVEIWRLSPQLSNALVLHGAALSSQPDRSRHRRGRVLNEANLLQTVTRGVVAALSKPSRDARRRCDLIEANLLQTVTRGVVAALSKPSRDARRRCDLIEANLIDLIDVSESSHNAPAKHFNPYSRRTWLGFTRT